MGSTAGSRAGQLYQQGAQQQPNQMWGPPAQQRSAFQPQMQNWGQQVSQAQQAQQAQPGAWAANPQMAGMAGQLRQQMPAQDQRLAEAGQAAPGGWAANPGIAGVAGQLQGAMQNPQVQQLAAQYGPQLQALAQQFGGMNLGALNQMPAPAAGGYVNPYGRAAGGTMADRMGAALAAAPQGGGISPEQWGAGPVSMGPAPGAQRIGAPAQNDLQGRLAAMYGQLGRVPRM